MAARQRPSGVKSQALVIRLAEKRKAMMHEQIARTRQQIELSWAAAATARSVPDEELVAMATSHLGPQAWSSKNCEFSNAAAPFHIYLD